MYTAQTAADALIDAFEFHRMGNSQEAERICNSILNQYPKQPDCYHLLGMMALEADEVKTAHKLVRKAIKLLPSWPDFHNTMGAAQEKLGKTEEAIKSFEEAIRLKEDYPEPYLRLGRLFYSQKKYLDSARIYKKLSEIRPDMVDGWNNLGVALLELNDPQQALAAFDRTLEINPFFPEGLSNKGNALQRLSRYTEALDFLNHALALRPEYADAWNTKGLVYTRQNNPLSMGCFQKAVLYSPSHPDGNLNIGFTALIEGDYETGWKQYEWRWKAPSFPSKPRNLSEPLWTGEPLEGKRIFIYAEQGHGDTLQFLRFIPAIAARGGEIILEVQPALKRLVTGMQGVRTILGQGEPIPPYDVQCPMMSLPLAFGLTLDTIPPPASLPYCPKELNLPVPDWGQPLRIGLAWAGNPQHKEDQRRSIPLELFAPLGDIPQASFVSLLRGPVTNEIQKVSAFLPIINACAVANDFTEVADQIEALDLVITVDTAIAHLAATMNKPTWLLIPYAPDWRWLRSGETSPWYPSIRIFRQNKLGDWAQVIENVREELAQLVMKKNGLRPSRQRPQLRTDQELTLLNHNRENQVLSAREISQLKAALHSSTSNPLLEN